MMNVPEIFNVPKVVFQRRYCPYMPSILVVDDQAEARRPLMKLLKLEGYDVQGAASALEALSMARQNQPDLLLLDVMIPQLDGLTLLMLLREEPRFRELPVVMLTGVCDEHTLDRARQLGVRDYLLKAQFSPEQLLGVIQRNLDSESSSSVTAGI
jgi:CheY-like chemotaxis protein